VDFRNTIVIMTSNIGARDIKNFGKGIGFDSEGSTFDYAKMKSAIQEALKKVFNPEFLNRVDDVIVFRALEKEDIFKIIDILTDDLFRRIQGIGYKVDITKGAKEFIAEKGYDPKFGARPLRRAIQKFIEDPLAEEILGQKRKDGSTIRIKLNGTRDGLVFDWKDVDSKASDQKESEIDLAH
jgi:ATP-dependent Clp protease ATP-binding subunit ClpC